MDITLKILFTSGIEEKYSISFDNYTEDEQFTEYAQRVSNMIKNNVGLKTDDKQITLLNLDKIQRINIF